MSTSGPGGIGFLVDEDTVSLWRFDEPAAYVAPRDAAGVCADLVPTTGCTAPAVGAGLLGKARVWAANTEGFEAPAVAGLLLTRDLTLEAIVKVPSAVSDIVLVAKGAGGGTVGERCPFQWEFYKTAGVVYQRFAWMYSDTDWTWADSIIRAESWLCLAVTRRWVSDAELVISFYLDGELVATSTSTDGTISGGTTGKAFVGIGYGLAGLCLDQLRISKTCRSAEELREIYRRMLLTPEDGYEAVRALLPSGQVYSTDPESAIQRDLRVEGDGVAQPWAAAEDMHANFLPLRAYAATLERWEALTGIAPRPGDDLDTRRTRVCAHLRTHHGYSRAQVRHALAELLAQDEDDIVITERGNHFDDDLGAIDALAWVVDEGGSACGWSIMEVGGVNYLYAVVTDESDARWDGNENQAGKYFRAFLDGDEATISVKMSSWSFYDDHGAGVFLRSATASGAVHIFGIRGVAGHAKFWMRIIYNYVVVDYYSDADVPAVTENHIRVKRYYYDAWAVWVTSFEHSADGGATWSYVFSTGEGNWEHITTIPEPGDCGLFVVGNSYSSESGAAFRDWTAWFPQTRTVFDWYVYRNPSDPGTADIRGAQAVVDHLKPAHTRGRIVESVAFKCDDAHSLCDRDLLGG